MMRHAVLAVAIGWASNATAAPELARDGVPSAWVVLPDMATEAERAAALEFVELTEALSGARLSLRKESASDGPDSPTTRVFLGRTNAWDALGIDGVTPSAGGFIVEVRGDDLYLVGDDQPSPRNGGNWQMDDLWDRAGTLHAVHAIFREQFGVRWIWPGESGLVAPEQKTLKLSDSLSMRYRPILVHRQIRATLHSAALGRLRRASPWLPTGALERMSAEEARWLRRLGQQRVDAYSTQRGHAFADWWRRYGVARPDYFALQEDGHREPFHGPGAAKLCVSNVGVWKQVLDDWVAGSHSARQLSVAENDGGGGFCTCSQCEAWDQGASTLDHLGRQTPSLSDRYVRFANSIAQSARDRGLDVELSAYAYQIYSDPPVATRVDPSVRIRFVPGSYPSNATSRAHMVADWEGWRSMGASEMYWRPNALFFGNGLPLVYGAELARDVQELSTRGLLGVDIDSLAGFWSTWGPSAYVVARAMEEPDRSLAVFEAEYYDAFGPAGGQVKAYFEHWRSVTRSLVEAGPIAETYSAYRNKMIQGRALYRLAGELYSASSMAKADELLRDAEAVTVGDDVVERIKVLREGLQGVRLKLDALEAFYLTSYQQRWMDPSTTLPLARALRDHRIAVSRSHGTNVAYQSMREAKFGDSSGLLALADIQGRRPVARLPLKIYYRIDPDGEGSSQHWQLSLRPDEAWSLVATTAGRASAPAARQWSHQQAWEPYTGPIWYLIRLERPSFARSRGDALFFPMVDGQMTAWLDGQELEIGGDAAQGQRVVHLPTSAEDGTVILRIEGGKKRGGVLRPIWLVESQ